MSERYACKQEVAKNVLNNQPAAKDIAIARNRANVADKIAEVISDHNEHSIQLVESEEHTPYSTLFIAELLIYR